MGNYINQAQKIAVTNINRFNLNRKIRKKKKANSFLYPLSGPGGQTRPTKARVPQIIIEITMGLIIFHYLKSSTKRNCSFNIFLNEKVYLYIRENLNIIRQTMQ